MQTRVLACDAPETLEAVLETLEAGGLVALPTETVYGLAGNATDGRAVARIFEAKGRPAFNPLIAHVSDRAMATSVARLSPLALALTDAFWPGPLTLVLPAAPGSPVHPLATAGLGTVAVRMPKGPARAIIAAFGRPLAAPSANRSGRVSPTSAAHVLRTLDGRVDLVVDGGACPVGVESTILKVEEDRLTLLRAGGVTLEDIRAAVGHDVAHGGGGPIEAPGQLASHYAPAGRVRLAADEALAGEFFIAFGPGPVRGDPACVENLSPSGDLAEAAARLFEILTSFDRPEIERIAVAPIPDVGLGLAINDRLGRAAAPRGPG